MSKSIYLHPKHGLNPTIPLCIVCGKEKNEIALLGNAYKGQAPMHMVTSIEPCDACREKFLTEGTMLMEATEDWSHSKMGKPRREPTGKFVILKDEAFCRIFNQEKPPTNKIAFCEEGLLKKITQ
jgi:hypothetical protein